MDFTEIIKAMETMTDAQITSIQKSADNIMRIREKREREAIQNFRKAFSALREAGVYVSIECECEDCCNEVYIEDVDQFIFS